MLHNRNTWQAPQITSSSPAWASEQPCSSHQIYYDPEFLRDQPEPVKNTHRAAWPAPQITSSSPAWASEQPRSSHQKNNDPEFLHDQPKPVKNTHRAAWPAPQRTSSSPAWASGQPRSSYQKNNDPEFLHDQPKPVKTHTPSSMAGSSKNVFQPSLGIRAATQLTPKEAVAPKPTRVFMSGRLAAKLLKPSTMMSRPGPAKKNCICAMIHFYDYTNVIIGLRTAARGGVCACACMCMHV